MPEVAGCLGRTVHATEALLVRARRAFRVAYGDDEPARVPVSEPSHADDEERRSDAD